MITKKGKKKTLFKNHFCFNTINFKLQNINNNLYTVYIKSYIIKKKNHQVLKNQEKINLIKLFTKQSFH